MHAYAHTLLLLALKANRKHSQAQKISYCTTAFLGFGDKLVRKKAMRKKQTNTTPINTNHAYHTLPSHSHLLLLALCADGVLRLMLLLLCGGFLWSFGHVCVVHDTAIAQTLLNFDNLKGGMGKWVVQKPVI